MTAVRVVVRTADVSVVVAVVAAGVAVVLLVDVLVAAIAAGWSGAFVVHRCVLA